MSSTPVPRPSQVAPDDPEALVESIVYHYPSITESRTDALAHLFLVIGNGYMWTDDGCLVYAGDDRPRARTSTNETNVDVRALLLKLEREAVEHDEQLRVHYQSRAHTYGPLRVPDDVNGEHVSPASTLARKPAMLHPAWALLVTEAEQVFAAVWQRRNEADAQRRRELDATPDFFVRQLAGLLVDAAYAQLRLEDPTYTQLRTWLQVTTDRAELDAGRSAGNVLLGHLEQTLDAHAEGAHDQPLSDVLAVLASVHLEQLRFLTCVEADPTALTDARWLNKNLHRLIELG